MRLIDIKQVQAALLDTADEIRAAAVTGIPAGLDDADRKGLLALADLVERQARGEPVIRRTLGNAIDRLIGVLDAIDEPDMDLEDGHDAEADSADAEPSLGSTHGLNQTRTWAAAAAGTDLEFDGNSKPDADLEDDDPYAVSKMEKII